MMLLVACAAPAWAAERNIHASIKAPWSSSAYSSLSEASEFLADDSAGLFFRFVDGVAARTAEAAGRPAIKTAADAMAVAMEVAGELVPPGMLGILRLSLAVRAHLPGVEMHRKLAADVAAALAALPTGGEGAATSISSCPEAAAVLGARTYCSVEGLAAALGGGATVDQVVTILSIDRALGSDGGSGGGGGNPTVLLLGELGHPAFAAFHLYLAGRARAGELLYVMRHGAAPSASASSAASASSSSSSPWASSSTPLQGYGVVLDIKKMEYKTIDDSAPEGKAAQAAATAAAAADKGEKDGEGGNDEWLKEDVDGFVFKTLVERRPALRQELLAFREKLIESRSKDDMKEIKVRLGGSGGVSGYTEVVYGGATWW